MSLSFSSRIVISSRSDSDRCSRYSQNWESCANLLRETLYRCFDRLRILLHVERIGADERYAGSRMHDSMALWAS